MRKYEWKKPESLRFQHGFYPHVKYGGWNKKEGFVRLYHPDNPNGEEIFHVPDWINERSFREACYIAGEMSMKVVGDDVVFWFKTGFFSPEYPQ